MSKNQSSIIEPTEAELALYKTFSEELTEEQLDAFSDEYYDLVQNEEINVSFVKFIIDKVIRPIKEADVIQFETSDMGTVFLFCLLRKNIEGKDYLLFAKVDEEKEELDQSGDVFLFYVDGVDETGMEIIDIMANGEETEAILNIMEESIHVEFTKETIPEE